MTKLNIICSIFTVSQRLIYFFLDLFLDHGYGREMNKNAKLHKRRKWIMYEDKKVWFWLWMNGMPFCFRSSGCWNADKVFLRNIKWSWKHHQHKINSILKTMIKFHSKLIQCLSIFELTYRNTKKARMNFMLRSFMVHMCIIIIFHSISFSLPISLVIFFYAA